MSQKVFDDLALALTGDIITHLAKNLPERTQPQDLKQWAEDFSLAGACILAGLHLAKRDDMEFKALRDGFHGQLSQMLAESPAGQLLREMGV